MLHEDRIQARQEQFKLAVLKRNIEDINYLGKQNINPNHVFIVDEQIYSPLIYAITHDCVSMLKALLAIKRIRAQAVVNETTALEVAAERQNKLMVALLLKSEHINYSQHEIDKAFSIAYKANSPTIEIFWMITLCK